MKSVPKIYCAVCSTADKPKQVTETTVYFNQMRDRWTFTVQCHGHIDSCQLDGRVFRDGWEVLEATAFKGKTDQVMNVATDVEEVEGEIVNSEAANDNSPPELPPEGVLVVPKSPIDNVFVDSFDMSDVGSYAHLMGCAL